jgi:hypothetical protein
MYAKKYNLKWNQIYELKAQFNSLIMMQQDVFGENSGQDGKQGSRTTKVAKKTKLGQNVSNTTSALNTSAGVNNSNAADGRQSTISNQNKAGSNAQSGQDDSNEGITMKTFLQYDKSFS